MRSSQGSQPASRCELPANGADVGLLEDQLGGMPRFAQLAMIGQGQHVVARRSCARCRRPAVASKFGVGVETVRRCVAEGA
jgi:hypothetical protein